MRTAKRTKYVKDSSVRCTMYDEYNNEAAAKAINGLPSMHVHLSLEHMNRIISLFFIPILTLFLSGNSLWRLNKQSSMHHIWMIVKLPSRITYSISSLFNYLSFDKKLNEEKTKKNKEKRKTTDFSLQKTIHSLFVLVCFGLFSIRWLPFLSFAFTNSFSVGWMHFCSWCFTSYHQMYKYSISCR